MKNRYADRRSKLGAMLPNNSAVVIAGAAVQYRNADSSHAFRQDSNFWYLTGFNEPESTLVLLINESKDVLRNLRTNKVPPSRRPKHYLLFIDLRKAFDTVDRRILLERLNRKGFS